MSCNEVSVSDLMEVREGREAITCERGKRREGQMHQDRRVELFKLGHV